MYTNSLPLLEAHRASGSTELQALMSLFRLLVKVSKTVRRVTMCRLAAHAPTGSGGLPPSVFGTSNHNALNPGDIIVFMQYLEPYLRSI